jgi:hypothetical protein
MIFNLDRLKDAGYPAVWPVPLVKWYQKLASKEFWFIMMLAFQNAVAFVATTIFDNWQPAPVRRGLLPEQGICIPCSEGLPSYPPHP